MLFGKRNANVDVNNESKELNVLKLGITVGGGIIATVGSLFTGKKIYESYKTHKSSEELLKEVDSSNLPEEEVEDDDIEDMKTEFEGILDYIKDPQNKDVVLVIRSTSGAIQRICDKCQCPIDALPINQWTYVQSAILDINIWICDDLQADSDKILELIKDPSEIKRAVMLFINFS